MKKKRRRRRRKTGGKKRRREKKKKKKIKSLITMFHIKHLLGIVALRSAASFRQLFSYPSPSAHHAQHFTVGMLGDKFKVTSGMT